MIKYAAHRYDDYLNLKISSSLWFYLLYGVRHLVFFSLMKLNPDYVAFVDLLNAQSNWLFIITDFPAALVLLATGHRLPEALGVMRWIWNHGKYMLVTSYVTGIFVFLYLNQSLIKNPFTDNNILLTTILCLDILIIIFIIKSELIKDIFNEFPPKPIKN